MILCDRGTIILAVYSAFSAAVIAGLWHTLEWATLLHLLAICAVLLSIVLLATRCAGRALGFSRQDEIAIIFCGSKKTLASGVPMARVLFAGPDMGAVVLPLMVFHQLQLFACAALARRYARLDEVKRVAATPAADPTTAQG
jgi:sodium/bile acid cotransporter 7